MQKRPLRRRQLRYVRWPGTHLLDLVHDTHRTGRRRRDAGGDELLLPGDGDARRREDRGAEERHRVAQVDGLLRELVKVRDEWGSWLAGSSQVDRSTPVDAPLQSRQIAERPAAEGPLTQAGRE